MNTAEVVIAGGGPNGLLLACELRLAGVRPVVLERLPARGAASRANGLVGQVVRMLDLRGLYERLAGRAGPPEATPFFQFGGIPLDLRALDPNPLHTLLVPQARIEQVLEERARELGVEIRRGHELTAHDQGAVRGADQGADGDGAGVTLDVRAPDGPYRMRARYLVGADGGHSLVRKQAGIGFPGTTDDTFSSLTGHAVVPPGLLRAGTGELTLPGAPPLRPYTQNRLPGGVFTFAEMPPGSGVHLVSVMEWHRPPSGAGDNTAPAVTFGELTAGVRRVLGTGLALTPPTTEGPHRLSRLTGVSSRQAVTYRAGRVLLLGDAAHVHSAVGGPGLNLGLQDAVNLGWKLAAEVRGVAPRGLLDTYETERAPVSRRVLMQTRAQMALMRPGEDITAARELLTELFDDLGNRRRIATLMAGPETAYGPWFPDTRPSGAAWPAVAERLRAGRAVLLDLGGHSAVADIAAALPDRVDLVTGRPEERPSAAGSAVLIRPDGYVAWSAPAAGPPHEGLREALADWFGTATAA